MLPHGRGYLLTLLPDKHEYSTLQLSFIYPYKQGAAVFKTILHATDMSENHFDLCRQSVDFAKSLGAEIYFLNVIETPTSLQLAQGLGFAELANPAKEDAQTVMSTIGDALNVPPSHLFVEVGSAYKHILAKISELNCDLVILGTHQQNLPSFLGSTAHAVVHHAPCAVLTIRTPKSE